MYQNLAKTLESLGLITIREGKDGIIDKNDLTYNPQPLGDSLLHYNVKIYKNSKNIVWESCQNEFLLIELNDEGLDDNFYKLCAVKEYLRQNDKKTLRTIKTEQEQEIENIFIDIKNTYDFDENIHTIFDIFNEYDEEEIGWGEYNGNTYFALIKK